MDTGRAAGLPLEGVRVVDFGLLMAGPYPMQLKRRVAGDRGHLSNKQAAALLAAIDCTRLQHLVLTHLSEINNTPEFARSARASAGLIARALVIKDWNGTLLSFGAPIITSTGCSSVGAPSLVW